MSESGDGGERPESEGPGAGAAFVPMMRKVTGPVFGAITVLAAVVGLAQPFVRSDAAATKVAILALAAFMLLAGVCVLAYIHRSKRVEVPLWLGIPGLTLVVGVMLAFALWPSGPRSASPAITATPSSTPASASVLDASLVAQAVASLGSGQTATRLEGIAALREVMQAVPADQPAAITALCDFLRKGSPAGESDGAVSPDVQAALTALADRDPADDGGAVIDLDDTNFSSAKLTGAHFAGASIAGENGADFSAADLTDADFSGADLSDSYFGDADVAGANFTGAVLTGASFYDTPLCSGNTPVHPEEGYNCTQ